MASLTRQRKPIPMRTTPLSSSKIKPRSHDKSSRPILSSYDDLPSWHQDNDFIRRGYRPVSNSIRKSLESWLYLHNETINIFSHLIPAVLFFAGEGLMYQYFEVHYPKSTNQDRLAFAFFLLTVATCFFLSVTYHTLMNHSDYISHILLRIDFVGIVIHTVGNFVSGIYMVFYCEPTLQSVYWTMVCPISLSTCELIYIFQDTLVRISNGDGHREPSVPRQTLANVPCMHLCGDRAFGICSSCPWN